MTEVLRLAEDVDGLVEDLGPGGLAVTQAVRDQLRQLNPNLVVVRISPFGQSGPHANWQASELVVQARAASSSPPAGTANPHQISSAHGRIRRRPARGNRHVRCHLWCRRTGAGQQDIDISAQETFLQHWSRHIGQWSYSGAGQRRDRRTLDGQGAPSMARAEEGWICLAVRNARWNTVAGLLGLDNFTGDDWQTASRPRRALARDCA